MASVGMAISRKLDEAPVAPSAPTWISPPSKSASGSSAFCIGSRLPALRGSLEHRLAFLHEGAQALGEIGLGGALRERLGFTLELALQAVRQRAVQQCLGAPIDGGRARRQPGRKLHGLR